jgi:hypothetical protein
MVVQPGDILVRLQRQFEMGIMVGALGRPERSRDQILLKIRPPSRTGYCDVTGFQPLVEGGQESRFIVWLREDDFIFLIFENQCAAEVCERGG